MPSARRTVEIYEELANRKEQSHEAQPRDRFLLLAADAALRHGFRDEAERLRGRLLQCNPHHLLRPYPSFAEALKSPDIASYLADLRDSYPPDKAGRLLQEEQVEGERTSPSRQGEPAPPADPEEEASEPEIYRFNQATEEQQPYDVAPAPPTASAPLPVRVPRPVPPAPAIETPEVFPYPLETTLPRPRRTQAAEVEEPPSGVGVWVSNGLFGLLLLAGVALLAYTLARPFLPW